MLNNKLQEYLENSVEAYELLKKKKETKLQFIIDTLLSGVLTLKDGLTVEGSHYLIVYEEKSLLVTIKNDSVIREVEVTDKINNKEKFKKVEYDGYIYKKYRSLKE